MSDTLPEVLFKAAMVFFLVHLACTALLRSGVDEGASVYGLLFGQPLLHGRKPSAVALLRVKYFWPFTESPSGLAQLSRLSVFLFWLARLAGFAFVAALIGFFGSMFILAGA